MQPPPAKFPKPILKKPPLPPNLKKPPLPPIAEPAPAPAKRRVVLPSSPFDPPKKQPIRINYCRFFLTALLILLVILAVAGGLFYLWCSPKLPVFKLRPVQFNRFAVTPGTDGPSYIQTGANVWVEVKNPNGKLVVYYGGSQMEISADDDVELGSASLPEFTQLNRNITLLRFAIPAGSSGNNNTQPVDEETAKRLNATVKSGQVKLHVEVKTKIGMGFGKFRTVMLPVDVACGGVSLNKLRDDGPPKCHVNWFRW